jgi:hypothetical protein
MDYHTSKTPKPPEMERIGGIVREEDGILDWFSWCSSDRLYEVPYRFVNNGVYVFFSLDHLISN